MIFLNGRILPSGEASLDPRDRGFLLGDGLFETLPCLAGQAVRMDEHLARLEAGAGVLGIPLPCPIDEIRLGAMRVLEANGLERADAALRITLSRGPGPRGLLPPEESEPTLMITAAALESRPQAPASAIIATTRRNEHSPLANLKTLNYLDNVLARREAAERGADEALLLNTAGRLASASAANLILVRDGRLLTPPVADGILPGITRALVLEIAGGLGIEAAETPLEREDLWDAQEAFVTNSLIELRPLVRVDDRAIGDGQPGPTTRRLHQSYEAVLR
jgi:branched-chain amino acid aminotransferase